MEQRTCNIIMCCKLCAFGDTLRLIFRDGEYAGWYRP